MIATRFGWEIDPVERKPGGRVTSRRDVVKHVVEGSLQRLGLDAIDLYYQHRVDPEVPIEEVAGAVKGLIGPARSSTSACPRRPPERSAARTRSSP